MTGSCYLRFPKRARVLGAAMLAGLAASCLASGASRAQTASPPAPFSTWVSALQSSGYGVTQGTTTQFTTTYCQHFLLHVFKNCLGTSLVNPFLVLAPPDGGEFVDPSFQMAGVGTGPDGGPTNTFYQLDSTNEALLTIMNVPPSSAYYSYESYIFTRPISFYGMGWQGKPSPDPSRALLFASFDNSINNVEVAHSAGFAFNSGTVAFITTANAALASALTQVFVAQGGNPDQVFVEAVAPDTNTTPMTPTNLGLGMSYDQLITVFRYSVPQNAKAATSWLQNANENMFVYRVDAPAGVANQPFGPVTVSARSINTSETAAHTDTVSELAGIMAGWLATQQGGPVHQQTAKSSLQVSPDGVITGGVAGPFCLAAGTFCTGDQQDTDAYKFVRIGVLPLSNIAIVVGVDHALPASPNDATYIDVAAQDDTDAVRIASNSDVNSVAAGFSVQGLGGSAMQALSDLGLLSEASPALMADLPNLFVGLFTRSCPQSAIYCGRPYTTLLPSRFGVTDPIEMVERAYVLPGYFNGANPDDLVSPIVIY